MARHSQSKRTSAPPPRVHAAPAAPTSASQPVPTLAVASAFGPGGWCLPRPPQSMASSVSWWVPGMQHPAMAGTSAEGSWWASTNHAPGANNLEESDHQVWRVDSRPSGGFLNFLKQNTGNPVQGVSNGTPSQPISVEDDNNGEDCDRSEKLLSVLVHNIPNLKMI